MRVCDNTAMRLPMKSGPKCASQSIVSSQDLWCEGGNLKNVGLMSPLILMRYVMTLRTRRLIAHESTAAHDSIILGLTCNVRNGEPHDMIVKLATYAGQILLV